MVWTPECADEDLMRGMTRTKGTDGSIRSGKCAVTRCYLDWVGRAHMCVSSQRPRVQPRWIYSTRTRRRSSLSKQIQPPLRALLLLTFWRSFTVSSAQCALLATLPRPFHHFRVFCIARPATLGLRASLERDRNQNRRPRMCPVLFLRKLSTSGPCGAATGCD